MGLARTAGTERNDVLASFDPFAAGQFQHLHPVELRDGGEVEAVEAFDNRERAVLMRRSTLRRSRSIISRSTSRVRYLRRYHTDMTGELDKVMDAIKADAMSVEGE